MIQNNPWLLSLFTFTWSVLSTIWIVVSPPSTKKTFVFHSNEESVWSYCKANHQGDSYKECPPDGRYQGNMNKKDPLGGIALPKPHWGHVLISVAYTTIGYLCKWLCCDHATLQKIIKTKTGTVFDTRGDWYSFSIPPATIIGYWNKGHH